MVNFEALILLCKILSLKLKESGNSKQGKAKFCLAFLEFLNDMSLCAYFHVTNQNTYEFQKDFCLGETPITVFTAPTNCNPTKESGAQVMSFFLNILMSR